MNANFQTWSAEHAHAPPRVLRSEPATVPAGALQSPLALEGWLSFNRLCRDVEPCQVRLTAGDAALPAVHAVYYLDQRGQIVMPPGNPYLPVAFESTPTTSRARLDRQWLDVGKSLVDDMRQRGVSGAVTLPPDIDDIRPWQWGGFSATMRYLYHLDFPDSGHVVDLTARRRIGKNASRHDLVFERVADLAVVFRIVERTGQYFDLDQRDLEFARDLVGENALRAYVCYASSGAPLGARVVLHRPGSRAVELLAVATPDERAVGADEFLFGKMLADLGSAGATGIDFETTVEPGVSRFATLWGARLEPRYQVEAPSVPGLVRQVGNHWRYWRLRREGSRV